MQSIEVSWNEAEIDSLQISAALKTAFHEAVSDGKIIYTPTAPIAYNHWRGLFYIAIDLATGSATYAIGAGLNGGYTVVEAWPNGLRDFFRQLDHSATVTAQIISPTANTTYRKGDRIHWIANYQVVSPNTHWTEDLQLDTRQASLGSNTLRAGYGSVTSVVVRIVEEAGRIGTIHPKYDKEIRENGTKYGIPPGILKAIIHKETQTDRIFDPRTSRYEPKRDYEDFSGPNPSIGMNNLPFSDYTLAGKNTRGATTTDGSRVASLPRDYRTTLKNTGNGGWQLRGIVITDRTPNNATSTTVAELYANDDDIIGSGSQGWPAFGIPAGFTGNFTPQFLISSSYGLGHVMYPEATETKDPQGNFVMKSHHGPHDLVDDAELGIEAAAAILKDKFRGLVSNDDCAGWSQAVRAYNGRDSYRDEVCRIYTSNYK